MRRVLSAWVLGVVLVAGFFGCGEPGDDAGVNISDGDAGFGEDIEEVSVPELPYAASVESFSPGEGAGYGEDDLPEVVLGPPRGEGASTPSLDVVSLGAGGTIVLGFGGRVIVDGEGADFVVFENAFYPAGDSEQVWEELGEVSVSRDGEKWETFDCEEEPAEPGRWPGCAGWRPTKDYDPDEVVPLDPEETGGDPFDLADVNLDRARFIRIRSVSSRGPEPKVGFDLDAAGLVHWERAGR